MFTERFRIRRNWLKGFCNVRTFEGHTQGSTYIHILSTYVIMNTTPLTYHDNL